ncbi:protein PIN-LIKES 3-like [Quercus lobata]|uniref:Auxin efflux carrier family protein n=1 Tax=Quercus lobata TaxID=97700 RepID=A0A7N2KTU9_QUELO|nr:protein PIN-LIKES 3-like [Quercus lobata]XP_030951069.1 protein PIN-LIKES 3-like [Quercus lobata]XP_030951070.1 protein PIN-LIKES 3-like [Quercus lobata]XP_030951072.1 protein PIN-LIKES 3-like [Quercus lobata]XP_030951073.1 protein PIN-LIKES 3-like [Quercus lobata]XP_030951074.1 protein PIN-LIKES 3-like [Quercus lobata]
MGLLELFITASIPVLKTLLLTALGSYLALESVDILGEDARKHLNTVVFYVFNPALVSTNLAKTITSESMLKLWFMPINILITFIIGSVLGWILVIITRTPPHLRGLVVGCCAAGNLGNILLIMIPAICKEKGGPFGAPDVCHTYGMAYVSLSMAIGAIYLWSYVYNIVRLSSRRITRESRGKDISRESSTSDLGSCTEPLLSSTKEYSICEVPKEYSITEDHEEQHSLPCARTVTKSEVAIADKIKQKLTKLFKKINLKAIFAPSTTGAIVGFTIGLIPEIRKLFIGEVAPLRVIQDSASLLSDGAIPALTLIVGGNLLRGLHGSGISKSLIFGIVVVRYIALPLTGILIIRGAHRIGLVHSDPLYQFILLLQYAVPPAMNIGVITQLFGTGESECSVILLWTYSLASVSLTVWSTFFMWLVS